MRLRPALLLVPLLALYVAITLVRAPAPHPLYDEGRYLKFADSIAE